MDFAADKFRFRIARCIAAILLVLVAAPLYAQEQAKKLIALLDYLGSDYRNAVKDGQVLSKDEYEEMQEFAKRGLELFEQLKQVDGGDKAGVEAGIKSLARGVLQKADPKTVADLAKDSKDKLIFAYKIIPYPRRMPSFANGKKIFDDNCAQCHGATGQGDGPGRESMKPKTPLPANFTDPERIGGLSPFKAFNTASFGIEGTAMASFAALSEEQRWQVAFYVFSLRFNSEQVKTGANLATKLPADLQTVATLATSADDNLLGQLKARAKDDGEALAMLAYLRRGLLERNASDPLLIARGLLREATDLYASGDREKAYQKSVEAYLDGFELAEPTLIAKDAAFGRGLENQFTQLRNAIRQGDSIEEVQKRHSEIVAKLDEAHQLLSQTDSFSGYYTFANSALIIFREGLEAALILATIIATLRVMGAPEVIRYIHMGWILALICGGLTWLATQTVLTLSGRHRESLEGFISVFAAVALFYVGYWLHTRSEIKRWHEFLQEKIQHGISTRRVMGLVGISFFAVYREAFEVVLFYQALWMQNQGQYAPILWGLGLGIALLSAASLAILKLGLKLPLKYFLGATGTLLYLVAFIFAGNGIKELQAALWVPSTPVSFPPAVPWLGVYPTIETLAAQSVMLCAFIGTSIWLARQKKQPYGSPGTAQPSHVRPAKRES